MRTVKSIVFVSFLVLNLCLSGCLMDHISSEGDPKDEVVANCYHTTQLKSSDAAEVLNTLNMPEYTVLSQSSSAIAASGTKLKGKKNWFNLVAFDENDLTATRKYIFVSNEKPKSIFDDLWPRFSYDSQAVLPQAVLDEPYTDEGSKRVAILKYLHSSFKDDINQVKGDDKDLAALGMMVNQAFNGLMLQLQESPAKANKLDEEKGIEFHHMSLDKGRIKLTTVGDVAVVKMRVGAHYDKFKDLETMDEE